MIMLAIKIIVPQHHWDHQIDEKYIKSCTRTSVYYQKLNDQDYVILVSATDLP